MSDKPHRDSPTTSLATVAITTPTVSSAELDLPKNSLSEVAYDYGTPPTFTSSGLMRSFEPEFLAYVEGPMKAGEVLTKPPSWSPLVRPNYYALSSRNRHCRREKKPPFCSGGVRSHPEVFNPDQNATPINNGRMSLVGKNFKLAELRTNDIEVMYDDIPERNSKTFFSDDDDDDDDDEKQGSTTVWGLQSPRASDYYLFSTYSKL